MPSFTEIHVCRPWASHMLAILAMLGWVERAASEPAFASVSYRDAQVRVSWPTHSGLVYTLESAETPASETGWASVPEWGTLLGGDGFAYTFVAPAAGSYHFRLSVSQDQDGMHRTLRFATGYPVSSAVFGRPRLPSFRRDPAPWAVIGFRMSIPDYSWVLRIAGVGGMDDGSVTWLEEATFSLNVHRAQDTFSREDMFGADPFHGNVVENLVLGRVSSAEVVDLSASDVPAYYVTFDLEAKGAAFVLVPGDYVVSLAEHGSVDAAWFWASSPGSGHHDIGARDDLPAGTSWYSLADEGKLDAAVDVFGRLAH